MPEWVFNTTLLLLCLFGLMALVGFGLARYIAARMRTVEQGHVAVVHWMDRFARVVQPGPYWLRPFEEEIAQVYVRQREASASAPKIFTDGGLGVTVELRYAYRLDPAQMPNDELYYTDADRKKQHEMLIREVLLDLVEELKTLKKPDEKAADGAKKNSPPLDMAALFSPFGGFKEAVLRSRLKERVGAALLPHGVIITSETVQVAGLTLPPGLGAAVAAYVEAPFSAAARSEFVRSVRMVEPDMADAALVQLLNILQNPSADFQSIFTTGAINPDLLLDANGAQVRQRLGNAPAQQPAAPPPSSGPQQQATQQQAAQEPPRPAAPPPRPAAPPPSSAAPGAAGKQADGARAGDDYPLVESDNALLKSTRMEHQDGR